MKRRSMVAVLVAMLALSSDAAFAQGPPPGGGGGGRPGGPPPGGGARFEGGPLQGMRGPGGPPIGATQQELEQLGLSEAQRTAFAALAAAEQKEFARIENGTRQAIAELDALLSAAKPDARAIDDHVARVSALHAARLEARIATVLGQYAKLTPDQRAKLERIRKSRAPGAPDGAGGPPR